MAVVSGSFACSASIRPEPNEKLASSYVSLIEEQLRNENLSGFERELLARAKERGSISQIDYETAHARYKECMAQSGAVADEHRFANGLIHSNAGAPAANLTVEQLAEIDFSCASGTLVVVDELYLVQQGNPDLLRDRNEAGAACLVREGIAPTSFSRDDFATAFDGPGFRDYDSLPFEIKDERVHMCLYVAGIVLGFAE